MGRILYLFDPVEYQPRRSSSETEFQACFEGILPDLHTAISYAFEKMREERSRLTPTEVSSRWPSEAVNRHIYSFLVNNSVTLPFVRKAKNTFYLVKGEYKLTFKKVDNYYKPSYHTTENSYLMEQNLTLDGDDSNSIIFIGYQADKMWSALLGTWAISRKGERVNWVIDFDNLESGGLISAEASPSPINPIIETLVEPELKLKRRDKRKSV